MAEEREGKKQEGSGGGERREKEETIIQFQVRKITSLALQGV